MSSTKEATVLTIDENNTVHVQIGRLEGRELAIALKSKEVVAALGDSLTTHLGRLEGGYLVNALKALMAALGDSFAEYAATLSQ